MIKDNFKLNINFEGLHLEVDYGLTENKVGDFIIYGFIIKCADKQNNTYTERKFLDFTKDLTYAKNTLKVLIDNQVLPASLINVLDDLAA